jgi:hypothetical protein
MHPLADRGGGQSVLERWTLTFSGRYGQEEAKARQ